jgi:serine/threonine protein kinase
MLTDGLCNIHPGIWTFGLYLFEILTGQYPFLNKSLSELLMSIRTWTPTFPSNQINLEEIQQIIIQL